MAMKTINAIIERAKDGSYSIYMDTDGKNLSYLVTGEGDTLEEAKADFESGYEDIKNYYESKGKDFEEVDMVYTFDVASFLKYYSSVFTLAGLSKITGIAKGQLSHYVTGLNKPNAKNEAKILEGLRIFAKDLTQLG